MSGKKRATKKNRQKTAGERPRVVICPSFNVLIGKIVYTPID